MNQTSCFSPAHILLPAEQIPLEQWGCVACDQFTSDRSYWERAAEAAAGSPSALNLILPETVLETVAARCFPSLLKAVHRKKHPHLPYRW